MDLADDLIEPLINMCDVGHDLITILENNEHLICFTEEDQER